MLRLRHEPAIADFTHCKIDKTGFGLLLKVAEELKVFSKVNAKFAGDVINTTENRQVLHSALRQETNEEVVSVQQRIKEFSDAVRSGAVRGYTGKKIDTVVAIGIGGSYLGPEFVNEALKFEERGRELRKGINLIFLANVDPIDFRRATEGVNVESTLFIIVSKTFTTAETMLNARLCRTFIEEAYAKADDIQAAISAHICAVSTNLTATKDFGIKDERVFGFWDFVGGRFSVSSAVGLLPLSLQYGFDLCQSFLAGMNDIDRHFNETADLSTNMPMMLGLIGWYNTYICGINSRAILPYCQALHRFPAHI